MGRRPSPTGWDRHGCYIHATRDGAWWTARVYDPSGALVGLVRETDWPWVEAMANSLASLWGDR